MSDQAMIGFGILLPDELHNFVRCLEVELLSRFNLRLGLKQSPHITFKRPFTIKNLDPYVEYFDELVKNTKPFEIKFSGFNYFEPNVIFLDVAANDNLDELHEKVTSDLKVKFDIEVGEFEGVNMKFHSSLAYGDLSPDTFQSAKNYLSGREPKFSFIFDSLGLFYQVDDSWIIYRRAKV